MNMKSIRERAGRKPWVFLYMLIYFPWFFILEHVVSDQYYLIECKLDHMIPFCEYFIVPYLFWFVYVAGSFLWFMLKEEDSLFYKFSAVMFGGMTIALIIYTVFPNGIHLRPDIDASRNLFAWLTSLIYKADTCTNVFPSLHVYTSAVIAIFVSRSRPGRENPCAGYASVLISTLIILSTVFLKQHSVLDLVAGNVMAWALCKMAFADADEEEEENMEKRRRGLVLR